MGHDLKSEVSHNYIYLIVKVFNEFICDVGMVRIQGKDRVWFILKELINVIRDIRYFIISIQLYTSCVS